MNNTETPEKLKSSKDKLPTIRLRKSSAKGKDHNMSTVILETDEKKFTFNLKNDKQFLDKNNINNNINIMRHSIQISDNQIKDLEKSIDNLNIEKKEEEAEGFKQFEIIKVEKHSSDTNLPVMMKESEKGDLIVLNKPGLDVTVQMEKEREKEREKIDAHYSKKINLVEESIELFSRNNVMTDENVEGNKSPTRIPFSLDIGGMKGKLSSEQENISKMKTQEEKKEIILTSNDPDSNIRSNRPKIVVIQKGSNKIHFITSENVENLEDEKKSQKSEESEFPYKICFLCDQFFLIDKTFSAEGCDHSFCRRCGKGFFEEKVEEGDQIFKCPVYKCIKKISNSILKVLVSDKHFCVIEGKEFKSEGTNITTNTVGMKLLKKKQSINNFVDVGKMDSIKFYNQKHVIDVNSNESFFIFNKAKEQFCVKCSEPALYGKTGKFVVKCLNCYHTICKFCLRSYSNDHFDIASFNYCKVYFRKRLRKASRKENQRCKNFWFTVLIILVSYFLIFFAILKVISVNIQKAVCIPQKKKKNKCALIKYLIYFLFMIILYTIITPFILFAIPYYPPLITLFL